MACLICFKLAALCFNTQRQTLPNIQDCAPQHFVTYSVPPPKQRLLQSLQIFRGLSAGPGLQIDHVVEIRLVGRPFRRCDEIGKIEPRTTPASLSLCGLERNLVEVSITLGRSSDGPKEPPRHPGCHGGNFYHLIDENQRVLICRANFSTKPSRTWDFCGARLYRRAGSLGAPAPVVLMIADLFDGESLFICEQNRCQFSGEDASTLVVSRQKLNPL